MVTIACTIYHPHCTFFLFLGFGFMSARKLVLSKVRTNTTTMSSDDFQKMLGSRPITKVKKMWGEISQLYSKLWVEQSRHISAAAVRSQPISMFIVQTIHIGNFGGWST
jgi:hypothetical protein